MTILLFEPSGRVCESVAIAFVVPYEVALCTHSAGDVPYSQLHAALALQLGFRLPDSSIFAKSDPHSAAPLRQVQDSAPLGWENLDAVPDFSALDDTALVEKMQADLPEEEASSGECLEMYYSVCHIYRCTQTANL